MKSTLSDLAVILNLLLMTHAAVAHSLPTEQPMMGDNIIVTRREADSSDYKDDTVSQFQAELANLSISSHLKDLYIHFDSTGVAEDTKVNTIESYRNEAKSKLILIPIISFNDMYFTDGYCGYYKFDVREDTIDGELIRAELHLLQKKSTILDGHYNVDIYYLLNESSHQSPLRFTFKHIDSMPGWKTFDITPIVLSWKQGLVNHGLQIRLTKGKEVLSCEGVFSQGEEDPMNTEPLLIVFTNDHDSMFFKRMVKEERKSLKRSHVTTQPQERDRISRNTNSACHRATLTVTAATLSTDSVKVLLPRSFDAGVCKGHCTKLQLSSEPDHAHILSLHYRNTIASLSDIPSRCCVPVSYRRVNMVLVDNGRVIRKNNVPAQATTCDCL